MICRPLTPPEPPVPLRFLQPGQTGQVSEVIGHCEQVQRLHELGVRSGSQIQMIQAGSPCIVRLETQRLCFRESDLIGILVHPGESYPGDIF